MDDKLKYIGSSALPVALTGSIAFAVRGLPDYKISRTLLMVSSATFFNRSIFSLISPDVESWKKAKNRYSTQVSISTGIGLTTSLLGSIYDGDPLEKAGVNVAVSTLGSWLIGNLIWLSDATILGENLALSPKDVVPDFYV